MKQLYRINAFSTIAWWIVCSIFVWPLAAVALAVVVVPIGFVFSIFQPHYNSSVYDSFEWLTILIITPIAGAVIGACMSFLQRWLLRTKLYWAADNWRKWTIIGAALGAYAVLILSNTLNHFQPYRGDSAIIFSMPIFIGIISAFQYLALRHAVKVAWLWIMGNIVGGIVFSGLIYSYHIASYGTNTEFVIFLAPAVLGAITGYVMLFLFEKKVLPMQPENELALDANKPKSIWDDAI